MEAIEGEELEATTGIPSTFEQQLSGLNSEWNNMVNDIENSCVDNECAAKKWWDFSRMKKKVLKWMEKKENDASDGEDSENSLDDITKHANKYKVT